MTQTDGGPPNPGPQVAEAVARGDVVGVRLAVNRALARGCPAETVLHEGLMLGMALIGKQFRKNEVYVPEVILAARAFQAGLALIRPRFSAAAPQRGKVVIGTVKDDLHDLGKYVVASMLEGAGFMVVDLGVDVAPEAFVRAVRAERPDILALSATLTTTLPQLKAAVEAVSAAGERGCAAIMVGGLAVTQSYATSIGADSYGVDGSAAVREALRLLSRRVVGRSRRTGGRMGTHAAVHISASGS